MTQGWSPVRMIRWPAQQQDRERCVARGIPHVVLVEAGSLPPTMAEGSTVLFEPVSQFALQRAVDDLAWSARREPSTPVTAPTARRRGSFAGLVAAML